MNKINSLKIKYGVVSTLIILAIFSLGLAFMPHTAKAEYYDDGYDHFLAPSQNPVPQLYSLKPGSANSGEPDTTVTLTGRGFMANSVARWKGSPRPTTFIDGRHLFIHLTNADLSSSDGGYINVYNPSRSAYSVAIFFKIKGYVKTAQTTNTQKNEDPNNYLYNQNKSTTEDKSIGNYSDLASNAIFGNGSFMPSGLLQWILFAIIILIIVVLVRKIFGGEARYHAKPAKHD
ncbi:MAG: hypothetical protein AAB510_00150 [Patescibacteria group bacterium]